MVDSYQDKLLQLEEVSLYDLTKTSLASPTTIKFAMERRLAMADYHGKKAGGYAPETTKLVKTEILYDKDAVKFTFLTEATENIYPPNHEYKDAKPGTGALEPDPSHLYDIEMVFENLGLLTQAPEEPNLENTKDWLWQTENVKLWSSSPSFHWQGFAFNLTQLDSAIYPVNITPTRWDKVHGDALLDKHMLDLFIHIKFFVNIMAGSLLNKLRGGKRPKRKPLLPQKPIEVQKPIEPQQVEAPAPEEKPEVPGVIPKNGISGSGSITGNASASAPKQPVGLTPTNQTTEINPGGPIGQDDQEETITPKQEGMNNMVKYKDSLSWKEEAEGLRAQGQGMDIIFVENTDILQDTLMEFDTYTKEFSYRFNEKISWQSRQKMFREIGSKNLREVTVEFLKMPSPMAEHQFLEAYRAIHRYVEKENQNFDIFHFNFPRTESTTMMAEMFSRFSEPKGFMTLVASREGNNFGKVFLVRNSRLGILTEAVPPQDEQGQDQPSGNSPEGTPPTDMTPNQGAPQGSEENGPLPKKEDPDFIPKDLTGKTALMVFFNANPFLKDSHGKWLQFIMSQSQVLDQKNEKDADFFPVFMMPKNFNETDEDKEIRFQPIKDFIESRNKGGLKKTLIAESSSLESAYRDLAESGYKNVIFYCPVGKRNDYDSEAQKLNIPQLFTFFKVIEFSGNPDRNKTHIAILDNDFDAFRSIFRGPKELAINMFHSLKNQQAKSAGMGPR